MRGGSKKDKEGQKSKKQDCLFCSMSIFTSLPLHSAAVRISRGEVRSGAPPVDPGVAAAAEVEFALDPVLFSDFARFSNRRAAKSLSPNQKISFSANWTLR